MLREALSRALVGAVMIVIGILIVIELYAIFRAIQVACRNQVQMAKIMRGKK